MRPDDVSTNTTPDQPGPGAESPLPEPGKHAPDRNLALELARVTEAASMAAARWVGRGDKNGADGAAVNAMRLLINSVSMRGVVVIGEGEKDEAPMLFNGEEVGDGTGAACDVAVDPIDGTGCAPTACRMRYRCSRCPRGARCTTRPRSSTWKSWPPARKRPAWWTSAPRPRPTSPPWPGPRPARRTTSPSSSWTGPGTRNSSTRSGRPGARIKLITDGDMAGAIMAAREGTGIDLMLGIGGTPEGIIAACALKCLGGTIQGRLAPRDEAERRRALDAGHELDRVLTTDNLVHSNDVFFAATGITDGELMAGVRYRRGDATTHSLVMRSRSGTIRSIRASTSCGSCALQLHRLRLNGHAAAGPRMRPGRAGLKADPPSSRLCHGSPRHRAAGAAPSRAGQAGEAGRDRER